MLIKRLTITLSSSLLLATALWAQDSLLLRDYQYVKLADPWLTSANAAALTRYGSANIADAELRLSKEKGGLTNYYASPDDLQADATVESFYRLSPRAVVFGAMSYNNFSGRQMGGSAFIDPTRKPFDIVEDSLTNLGRKHRDTYQLTGALGIDLFRGLSAGIRLDYTSANYAKYKDLRHKNKLMDMKFTAGLYAPLGHWGAAGLNYLYHRTTESLQFSTYGRTDRTYKSLICYAAFMGHVEQFGSNGYTDRSREMPLVDDYNGLGLQLSLRPLPALTFYNAFTWAKRRGYYGRKSPYTVTYSQHTSHTYQWDARLSLAPRSQSSRYDLDLTLSAEKLQNKANTYREQQNDASATYYEYYTPVKTADKLWVDGRAALSAYLGIKGELPLWHLQAGLAWQHRKHTAYLYPYYRRQRLTAREVFVDITRHVPLTKGVWTFMLHGAYGKGSGEPFEDKTFTTPSDKQSAPDDLPAGLWREYQWLMAPSYTVGGSASYAFRFPGTNIMTRASVSLQHRKANQTYAFSSGKDRTQLSVALGCNF